MKIAYLKQRAVHTTNKQRGASLLEGVAYLGIAALVLIGAVSLLGGAFSDAQSNRALEELIGLRTGAKKLYSGQIYPADMMPPMVAAKAVPGTLAVSGPATAPVVKNGFGGTVTVVGTNGTGQNTFTIAYPNVTPASCIAILSGSSGWTDVKVGTTSVTAPITAAAAQTACGTTNSTLNFTSS